MARFVFLTIIHLKTFTGKPMGHILAAKEPGYVCQLLASSRESTSYPLTHTCVPDRMDSDNVSRAFLLSDFFRTRRPCLLEFRLLCFVSVSLLHIGKSTDSILCIPLLLQLRGHPCHGPSLVLESGKGPALLISRGSSRLRCYQGEVGRLGRDSSEEDSREGGRKR